MKKIAPVVFGESPRPKRGSKMRLEKSKYLAPKKEPNKWREIEISEDVLKDALEYALRIRKGLSNTEHIERLIVGEKANGVLSLSVEILKGKEV